MLYSAAGNSADEQWYRKGIISYSFETGADRFITNPTTGAMTQIITGFQPCFSGRAPAAATGTCNANLINEGRDQAMEFAGGNYGMVESAYDYAMDTKAAEDVVEVSADEGTFAGQLQVQLGRRGGGHPLHDRRLDADPGVDEVQQPARSLASARC